MGSDGVGCERWRGEMMGRWMGLLGRVGRVGRSRWLWAVVLVGPAVAGGSWALQAMTARAIGGWTASTYGVLPDVLVLRLVSPPAVRGQQVVYRPGLGDRVAEPQKPGDPVWLSRWGQTVGALVGRDRALLYELDRYDGPAATADFLDELTAYRLVPTAEGPGPLTLWPEGGDRPEDPAGAAAEPPESLGRSGEASAEGKSNSNPNSNSGPDPDSDSDSGSAPAPPGPPLAIRAVYRKSMPTDSARIGPWSFAWPVEHRIYLKLGEPLQPGQTYRLRYPTATEGEETQAEITFRYDPRRDRSEAVRVSQLGFRPDDPLKVGYLSEWAGSGGGLSFPTDLSFWVKDRDHVRHWNGKIQLAKGADQAEDPYRNYTGTPVYRMDFSGLDRPGRYRLCVETVGCSFEFEIGDRVWETAFGTAMQGFLHQRSGIALGPPQTPWRRPRPFHPEDGVQVYQSTARLMDVDMGLGKTSAFEALVAGKTDEVLPDAWGGYFDAGDWDRRIQHLDAAHLLMELVELFPDWASQTVLAIPEAQGSPLPDLVDEVLWGVDLFRRLQKPDGGVGGGIESAEHPRHGEASWQESQMVLAYGPDPWSSYGYGAAAARVARLLEPYDRELAATYRTSALGAIAWAEGEWQRAKGQFDHHGVRDRRNLAALLAYQLTGEESWHDIFKETTVFANKDAPTYEWQSHDQRLAAFLYAQLPRDRADETLQKQARAALLREADTALAQGQRTAFGWTKRHPYDPVGWGMGLGAPRAEALLRAHALTGDVNYLTGAIAAAQFSLGANPNNTTYTTGLGWRSPRNPLAIDWRILGRGVPPGITVYGPLDTQKMPQDWATDLLAQATFPPPKTWPVAEAFFDVYFIPAINEYTLHETIAPSAYTWGYLAGRAAMVPKGPEPPDGFERAIPPAADGPEPGGPP
ncbi:MAG: glycoside hydrolase family 9 protein [Cyanobacteria bacterium]|nr:glycoside hydrolase family 9 protein [Cyanobacteriota bacterium]